MTLPRLSYGLHGEGFSLVPAAGQALAGHIVGARLDGFLPLGALLHLEGAQGPEEDLLLQLEQLVPQCELHQVGDGSADGRSSFVLLNLRRTLINWV